MNDMNLISPGQSQADSFDRLLRRSAAAWWHT